MSQHNYPSSPSCSMISSEDHQVAAAIKRSGVDDVRRGPWTVEEDLLLVNFIATHGEGRWNALARSAGLKRTGKSCRLRWLNYLRPDIKRGNITPEEQLLILDLHSRWGNRWSKIAEHLPGRTDNEIKNYWRTRVQKHAKQLQCDVNSKQFKDLMQHLWMPRLLERINANNTGPNINSTGGLITDQYSSSSSSSSTTTSSSTATACGSTANSSSFSPTWGSQDYLLNRRIDEHMYNNNHLQLMTKLEDHSSGRDQLDILSTHINQSMVNTITSPTHLMLLPGDELQFDTPTSNDDFFSFFDSLLH